jgi:aminomethyltransferase
MDEVMSSAIAQSPTGAEQAAGSEEVNVAGHGGLAEEYRLLREGIGMSCYDHLGKFKVAGADALELANRVVMADVSRLPIRKMLATFILRPDGAVRAEVHVANLGDGYLLLTEGAPPAEIADLLKEDARAVPGAQVVDLTHERALFSLDGPYAWELMKELLGMGILGTRYLEVVADQTIAGVKANVYRAGKTGEFGYWIECAAAQAPEVKSALLESGKAFDLASCGAEARDVCRLENRFVNMECEGRLAANVLELNCRTMVSGDKGDYLGREGVERAVAAGLQRRIIGLTLAAKGAVGAASLPPDAGAAVTYRGKPIGSVANATFSYGLGRPIAVAFLDVPYAYVGLDYEVAGSAAPFEARTVSAPFVFNRSLSIRFQEHSYLDRERP